MVDLPGVPRRLVTTEETNFASGELAAAPMRYLADALDSVGQKFEQAGIPAMEAAGEKSVSVDKDGNPVVSTALAFGPAMQAYNRGAKVAYGARLGSNIDIETQKLREKYAGDPAGFKAAGDQYVQKIADNAAQGDPVLAGPAKMMAQKAIDENYLGIQKDVHQKDIQSQTEAIKTRIGDLDDKMIALARQKGGVDTPEFKSAAEDYTTLLMEQVKNPNIAFPKEKALSMASNMKSRAQAEATVGDIDEIYQKDGFAAAQQEAEKRLWSPDLNLSPVERRQAQEAVMGHIRIQESERRVDLRQTKALAMTVPAEITAGAAYRPEDVEDLAGQLEKLGDPGGAARFRLEANKALTTRGLSQLNLHDRAQARERLVFGGAGASDAYVPPANAADLPVGMQNNNPGNLKFFPATAGKYGGVVGSSKNKDQGDPQIVFATPQAGMKAAYQLALQKYNEGLTTANQIIADATKGWTPGNKTAAANIAATAGVGPDEDLKINTPEGATKFLRGIVKQEHGDASKAYTDQFIRSAITGGPGGPAPVAGPSGRANYANVENMGDPLSPGWKQANIVPVSVGGANFEVNKAAAPAFQGFLQDLAAAGYSIKSSGGYNYRNIRGSSTLSQHSFGNAIDINAPANPQGGGKSDLPPNVAALAAKHGLIWGGNWSGKERDPMHFEWAGPGGVGGSPQQAQDAGGHYHQPLGPKDGSDAGLTFDPSLVAGVVTGTKKDFDTAFPPMQSAVAKGQPLSEDEGETLKAFAPFLSEDDKSKVRALIVESAGMQGMVGGFGKPGMSAIQRQSLLNAVDTAIAQGADAPQRAMVDHFKAVDAQLTEQEKTDPYGRGLKGQWIPPRPPLDLTNAASIAARDRDMQVVAQRLGVPALPFFRPPEATSLVAQFANMEPKQVATMVGVLYQNLDRATFTATMKQLHDGDPNSSIPWAGSLYRYAPSVAESIIAGEKALTANSKLAPPREDQDTVDKTQEVLPTTALGGGGAAGYQQIVSAARARYADISFRFGDQSGKLNADRWQQALNEVTGGILDYQGNKVIAPVPGMSQAQFDDRLKRLTDDDLFGAVMPSGKPFTASIIATGYGKATPLAGKAWMATTSRQFYPKLQSVADGQYLINMGTNDAPMYVQRKVTDAHDLGGAFVLDLRSRL